MTQCLQDMTLYAIDDLTNLLITPPESIKNYEHGGRKNVRIHAILIAIERVLGFIVNMFLSEEEIKFEPSYNDFETVFLSMYDLVVGKCSSLPRIEAKLFSDRATVSETGGSYWLLMVDSRIQAMYSIFIRSFYHRFFNRTKNACEKCSQLNSKDRRNTRPPMIDTRF
jgi:hypothetical protein